MASVDEQIQLAEQIASQLQKVSRNEWMRWMQVAKHRGLDYAIHYAERLSHDRTMRPAIQQANRRIAQVLKQRSRLLKRYSDAEQQVVLGYVAWWRRILEENEKQDLHDNNKHKRKRSRRR